MTKRTAAGYIGPELMLSGELSGEGDVRIDGRFEGTLSVDGRIEVGPGALCAAPVTTRVLEVAGRVRGDVRASESVAVRDGGRIEGDVTAPRIAIDDGGVLHGGVFMDFELPEGWRP